MKRKKAFRSALLYLACMLVLEVAPGMASAENIPTAENLELTTEINTGVEGSFSARGGAGEALTFEITTPPVKGSVRIVEEGRFVYTPRENKKGRDYFGYRAVDAKGNRSQEATVLIRIKNQPAAKPESAAG